MSDSCSRKHQVFENQTLAAAGTVLGERDAGGQNLGRKKDDVSLRGKDIDAGEE